MSNTPKGGASDSAASELMVEVIIKTDCHLCDEAVATVRVICEEMQVKWSTLDVAQHPDLAIEYLEYLPVVLIDGVRHDFWHVDADRLRNAICQNRTS